MNQQGGATKREQAAEESSASLKGDEDELFELYGDHLLRVVGAATRATRETVEDACSFAWAQLLRRQPERTNIVGWLRVVAVHEVYRLWKKTRAEYSLEEPWPVSGAAASGALEVAGASTAGVAERAELDSVLAQIADLPERRRRIFELHLSGLSYREIGEATGEGPRAIDRQIKKARTRLRRDFRDAD